MACWARQDSLIGSTTMNRMPAASKRKKPAKNLRFGRRLSRLFSLKRRSEPNDAGDAAVIYEENGIYTTAVNSEDINTVNVLPNPRPSRGRTASGSSASGFVRRALRALSGSRNASRIGEELLPLSASDHVPQEFYREIDDMPVLHETPAESASSSTVLPKQNVAEPLCRSVSDQREVNDSGSLAIVATLEDNKQHSVQVSQALATVDISENQTPFANAALLTNYSIPSLDAARSQPMSKHHRNRLQAVLTPVKSDAEEFEVLLTNYLNDLTALFLRPNFILLLRAQEVFSENFCVVLLKLSSEKSKRADAAVAVSEVSGGNKRFLERLVVALEKRSEFAYYCLLYCLMLVDRRDIACCIDVEASKNLAKLIQSQQQTLGNFPESVMARLVWPAMGGKDDETNKPFANIGGGDAVIKSRPQLNAQTSISESFKQLQVQGNADKSRNSSLHIEPFVSSPVAEGGDFAKMHPDYFNLTTKPDFSNIQVGPFHEESDNVYRMRSRPRGGALIINNVDFAHGQYSSRTGSEVDGENLERLMKHLSFQLFEGHTFANQDSKQIKSLIRRFCNWKPVHAAADACFVAILTHGEHNNRLFAYDGLSVSTTWFERELANVPELAGKPKIFLFVACRGDEYDNGVPSFYLPAPLDANMPPPVVEHRQPRSLLPPVHPQRRSTLDIHAALAHADNSAAVQRFPLSIKSSNDASSNTSHFAGSSGVVSAAEVAEPMSASSLTRSQGNMARFWTYVRPDAVEHHQRQQFACSSKQHSIVCGGTTDDVDGTKDILTTTDSASFQPISTACGPYHQLDLDAVADARGNPALRKTGVESSEDSDAEAEPTTTQTAAATVVANSSQVTAGLVVEPSINTLSSVATSAEELNVSRAIMQPPQSAPAHRRAAILMRQASLMSSTNTSITSTTVAHMLVQPTNRSSTEIRSAPLASIVVPIIEPQQQQQQPVSMMPAAAMRIPLYADQCAIYSSYPNHRSLRNVNHGTWFINMLIKVVLAYGHVEDLSSLITKVNQRVSQVSAAGGEKSISQFTSTFTKKLYFNPHYPAAAAAQSTSPSIAERNYYASGDASTTTVLLNQVTTSNAYAASSSSLAVANGGGRRLVDQLRLDMPVGKR